MGHTHIDITAAQSSRREGQPCGDVVWSARTPEATTLIGCDGIGTGVKAHIAAQFAVSRLAALLQGGLSPRRAFAALVAEMERRRLAADPYPYAVLTLARMRPDGAATVLTYEMPPPLLVAGARVTVLPQRTVAGGSFPVSEAEIVLGRQDALCIVSDGITQAGLGKRFATGWGIDGVCGFIGARLREGLAPDAVPECICREAARLSGDSRDDCSAVLVQGREGRTVTVLTGPPAQRERDDAIVRGFLDSDGTRVICGGTTSDLAARVLGRAVEVQAVETDGIAPPAYRLEGVDLVTEGAITLNQAYNILGEDPALCAEESGVTELLRHLAAADRIRFIVGTAENPAARSINFRQAGILSRRTILPLLADKLRASGKLVEVQWV